MQWVPWFRMPWKSSCLSVSPPSCILECDILIPSTVLRLLGLSRWSSDRIKTDENVMRGNTLMRSRATIAARVLRLINHETATRPANVH